MPPLSRSRHARAQARPDYTGTLVLGLRARVELPEAVDDIYVSTLEGDTPWGVSARAWPTLRIPANRGSSRPEGFSPAELWWVLLDLIDQDDPLVPISGGQRLRLPSAARILRDVLS